MPNRPVISVDIDSEPFKRFQRLFDQYSKDVKAVNAEWKAMAANSNAALAPLAGYADRAAKAHQRLSVAIHSTGKAMAGLAKTGASFAHTVESITKFFTKWGALTAGIGFFGLDRLAGNVFEKGRSAAGIGVSVGQQSAFRVNMGQVLGSPDNVLSNVANAQQDFSKWWALTAMGVNPLQAQRQSPFGLSLDLAAKAREIWKAHPNVQYAEARGLTQFFSIEDLRRMGSMSDKDFAAREASARRDVTSLSFGAKQQAEWTALSIQLRRAGEQIEAVLVKGLSNLTPELGKLSAAVVDMISSFFKSGEVKSGIESLASGIKDFSIYVTSPEFKASVRTFVDDIEIVAKKIAAALKWLGIIPDDNKPAALPAAPPGTHWDNSQGFPILKNDGAGAPAGSLLDKLHRGQDIWGGSGVQKESFRTIERANGLPPGVLNAVYQAESGGGRNLVSRKGALGPFQFMPGTAAQYGVSNPFSLSQSARGAGSYLSHLLAQFGGNLDMALAAYNWGEGNLQRDIARYGSQWRAHLPRETQRYIDRVTGGMSGDDTANLLRGLLKVTKAKRRAPSVGIQIHNNTAGQVAIQANNLVAI